MVWFCREPLTSNAVVVKELYARKLTSMEDAVRSIEAGAHVVLPSGAGHSKQLLTVLNNRLKEISDVKLHHLFPLGELPYLDPALEGRVRHISWFCTAANREAVRNGKADVLHAHFHHFPRVYNEQIPVVDVHFLMVSSMDEHGYFSMGIHVDTNPAVARKARKIVLLVNPHMPRTLGDCFIHVAQADVIVEVDEPLIELPSEEPSERDRAIASYVAELIEDGSTIQLGIGSIPNAIAQFLRDKKDLGIHTEMITDSMVDLVECGAVTNRYKTLHPGKIVGTFAAGTRRLYNFLHNNPLIEMHPVSYTNDPLIIARNRQMVSVNATLEVDLLGQCASESIGPLYYSGSGGQVDFVRGAVMAPGGKSFLVLYSTASNGCSKIVPALRAGTVVTTGKNDVDYVVTEYGVAHLRGRTASERARALINIAHPDFRADLRAEARRMHLI